MEATDFLSIFYNKMSSMQESPREGPMAKLSLTSRVLGVVFWVGVTVLGIYLVYPKTGRETTPEDAGLLVKIHNTCEGIFLLALGVYSVYE